MYRGIDTQYLLLREMGEWTPFDGQSTAQSRFQQKARLRYIVMLLTRRPTSASTNERTKLYAESAYSRCHAKANLLRTRETQQGVPRKPMP